MDPAGPRLSRRAAFALALPPLGFLVVLFAWPVASIVGLGLAVPEGPRGVIETWADGRTLELLLFTLGQAACSTLLALLVGLPLAGVLARYRFPGRRLVRAAAIVPFVLPTVVVGVAFRTLLVPGGPLAFLGADGTFGAIVAALVFFNYAVVVRTVGGLWERLDPRAEQAARALRAEQSAVADADRDLR